MTVSSATFISDIVLFLKNYLKDNISDPLARDKGFVMTSYPKRETNYPLITIRATNISSRKLGMRSNISFCSFDVEVRIWARDSKESDTITQEVIDSLRQAQYATSGTNEFELFDFKLGSTNSIVEENNEATIHSKVCTYNYKVVLDGS